MCYGLVTWYEESHSPTVSTPMETSTESAAIASSTATLDPKVLAELEKMKQENARLQARVAYHDDEAKSRLDNMKPVVQAYLKTLSEDAVHSEHKPQLDKVNVWASNIGTNPDRYHEDLTVSTMISCASQSNKRSLDTEAALKEKTELLAEECERSQKLQKQYDDAVQQIAVRDLDLKTAEEAKQKLNQVITAAGIAAEKADFNSSSARYNTPAEPFSLGLDVNTLQTTACAASASAASAPASRAPDPFMNFLNQPSNGDSLRMRPSSTAHHFLGTLDSSADIASAISRM